MKRKKRELTIPALTIDENGNTQIVFDSDHMEVWKKLKLIPKSLLDALYQDMERSRMANWKLRSFMENNLEASFEDLCEALWGGARGTTRDENAQRNAYCKVQMDLHEFMIKNWDDLLRPFHFEKKLFKDVDSKKNFGVSRIETDPLYRLRDLLDNMKVLQIRENEFKARGEIKNSKGCSVVLEYEFKARNQQDADSTVSSYKKMMIKKGLQVFLSFWKTANKKGQSQFNCTVSEVMKLSSSNNRDSYFNDEERTEFWFITRSLASTKFKLEWPAQTSPGRPRKDREGKRLPRFEWIEQPLIQIHGGEKELGEHCPTRLFCTVLTQKAAEKRFAPALLSNETLELHPSDIYFAVVIQARAAQRGEKEISYDWGFTYRAANVEGKARANRRAAKTIIRKKLGKYQEKSIIEEWREDRTHVHITTSKYIKKSPQIKSLK